MPEITLHHGHALTILGTMPDNHFDSCICDPPYEMGFMGKKWDSSGIAYSVEMWREVWRVMKPGAYLLAFGGARTYHRMACAIEDAGFVMHPMISWIFGSGFPKATNIGKAIDKAAGAEREVVGEKPRVGGGRATHNQHEGYQRPWMDDPGAKNKVWEISAPATPLARQWDGWFYGRRSLKPALEPICMAQKPPDGKMLDNLLKWGCGGVNVKGCMVEAAEGKPLFEATTKRTNASSYELKGSKRTGETANERWPANVIHDGSDEVLAEFAKYGELKSGTLNGTRMERKKNHLYGVFKGKSFYQKREKSLGTAARFFYCAKASPAERNLGCEALPLGEPPKSGRSTPAAGCQSALGRPRPNHHPTVKPLALMAYLVRLVTPPGCLVLDPFMGSGSTLIAAAKEGFDSVGIDLEAEYLDIAAARIQGHLDMLVEISRPHYPYAGSLPKTTL